MLNIPLTIYEKYTIYQEPQPDTLYEIELWRLAEKEGAREFAEAYAPHIKALSLDVTATYFTANFTRVITAFHYALWHDGLHLDLTLRNLTVRIVKHPKGFITLNFGLKKVQGTEVSLTDRKLQIISMQTAFYREEVRPLLESLASVVGISVGMLWGVIPTYFQYYHDLWFDEPMNELQRMQLASDMEVLHQLSPVVFGRVKNPLVAKFRYMESPYEPGEQIRMKNTCCLAYKTEGGDYCITCPRLNDTERTRRIEEYKAKQA
jgi:ferric iron reductase protein FhuF